MDKKEPELEKHEDSEQETPVGQTPEPSAEVPSPNPSQKLQDELAESKDKYLRLYAEFENHRRRTARERLELIQTAGVEVLRALLPIVDDFERAEKSYKGKEDDKESEGFFLIKNKFLKILEQSGVTPMETKPEDDFNPDLHEAITQIAAPDERLKGKILDVVEKGYLLNEKVIRFAKVVVGA